MSAQGGCLPHPMPIASWDTHTPANCMLGYTPPPMNRMTGRCKNITLPPTLLAGGKKIKQQSKLHLRCEWTFTDYSSVKSSAIPFMGMPLPAVWRLVLLNIGSIRIYILTTGVVSNETNTYVRMYIEEFILVDIWIHWS